MCIVCIIVEEGPERYTLGFHLVIGFDYLTVRRYFCTGNKTEKSCSLGQKKEEEEKKISSGNNLKWGWSTEDE